MPAWQKSVAVGWHYAHLATMILDGLDSHLNSGNVGDELAYAQKLKNAARKLIEDSVERDRSEPTRRRR